jgi:transposase-like protein
MSGPRNVGRGAYWRSVFEQHADSGLSIRRFCQENDISQSTFFAWRKKLSKDPSLASSDRAGTSGRSRGGKSQVKPSAGIKNTSSSVRWDDQPTASSGMSFVAVKLPAESEPIEVVHPQGYVVRITSRANLDCLAGIFQILDQHATK